ncbi:diguanylate cyclase [Ancylobacter sp. A5.8]|uniref:sensor domain-containing diguanylate cyclase n=1 Tax=Ancylobacter gelatini TaxID=2919920 RepID=UPI001F4EE689|nr:diguanylate cyclase [Ancylobacter gelatini]MCJ8144293.1 diguanylate cyclase [Ancylobacter gelatini]
MSTEALKPYLDTVSLDEAYGSSPAALCLVDRQMRCIAANEGLAQSLGRPLAELVGAAIGDVLPAAIPLLERGFRRVDRGEALTARRLIELPGTGRTFRVKAHPYRDADGAIVALSCAMLDVTEEQAAIKALQDMEQLCNFALQSARQWIWEYNLGSGVIWRSPHWKLVLGYELNEAVAGAENVAWGIVHPEDRRQVQARFDKLIRGEADQFEAIYRVRHKNGRWLWILSRGKVVENDSGQDAPLRVIATSVDISHQKQIEEELSATVRQREALESELIEANRRLTALSEIDPLTELPNRRKLDQVLALELRRRERNGSSLALLMIDVDHFKDFNDLYGHPEGDECLRLLAGALRSNARRSSDMVARYGGEEFVAVLAETGEAEAVTVAENMLAAVRALKLPHAGSSFNLVSISIGVAVLGPEMRSPATSLNALVRAADNALYAAKQGGRNAIAIAPTQEGAAMRLLPRSERSAPATVDPPPADGQMP